MKKKEIQRLLKYYKIRPSIPKNKNEIKERIRTNLIKFQDTIVQKKNYYLIDSFKLVPLYKDKMMLRELFSYLPNESDAEKFNNYYIMDKLQELKIIATKILSAKSISPSSRNKS